MKASRAPKYKVHTTLHKYDNPESVSMTTSKGTRQQFHRLGYFELDIEGRRSRFKPTGPGSVKVTSFFIPFRDGTLGKESYGAARYLDIEEEPDNNYTIDFNYAYNPYCAYSEDYICPLPPTGSWLELRILAGEMS